MYVRESPNGVAPAILTQTAGLTGSGSATEWLQISSAPVRALRAQGDYLYVVQGGRLHRVDAAKSVTVLGPVLDRIQTTISGNGLDVAVAAGGQYNVWDGVNSVYATIAVPQLTSIGTVAYLNARMAISGAATDRLAVSSLNDATGIAASDFSSAERSPDKLRRVFDFGTEIWLFGALTTEIWGGVANVDFPFAGLEGGLIRRGLGPVMSVAATANRIYWITHKNEIYEAGVGAGAQKISTPAVARDLQNYDRLDEVVGVAWMEGDHEFYAIRFPNKAAWVFDVERRRWHRRASGYFQTNPWIGCCAADFDDEQLIGGSDGAIYRVDPEAYADGSIALAREVVGRTLLKGSERFRLDEFILFVDGGKIDADPEMVVEIQMSRDGGVTFGRPLQSGMGLVGDYGRLTSWRNFGVARQFTPKIRFTESAPFSIYGADWRVR